MPYVGWDKMPKNMSGALKRWIGVKKYGKGKFQRAAAQHKTLRGARPVYHSKKKRGE